MCRGASRQERNTLDNPFRLIFVERIYDACPRWYSSDWQTHVNRPAGTEGWRLHREPGVRTLIDLAHRRSHLYTPQTAYLYTCINSACDLRTFGTYNPQDAVGLPLAEVAEIQRAHTTALRALARGRVSDLELTCPNCSGKRPTFPVTRISKKWVYVLRETGRTLTPQFEVYSETPETGTIYTQFRNGRFMDARSQAFQGSLTLRPNPTAHAWHFFLSPVRLGPRAIELLCRTPQDQGSCAGARERASPQQWNVGVIPQLQPWVATVMRRFSARQVAGGIEAIPLVDPFTWVAEAVDFDYLPILAAQHALAGDADEQAKAFVSGTLAQVIGRRQTSDDPPRFEEDTWDVQDDTVPPPSGFQNSGNIAQAWLDRYNAAVQYLSNEALDACKRVIFPVRYSLGHRIVELACQENARQPEFLCYGLLHWNHVLREILACRAGEAFVTWLVRHADAREWIPKRNVLDGTDIGAGSQAARDGARNIAVQILANLSPVVVSRASNPASTVAEHLSRIDVQATALGNKEIRSTRNLVLDIAADRLDKYIEKLPQSVDPQPIFRRCVAENWQNRLKTISTMRQFEEAISLLSNLAEYNREGRRFESEWDWFSRRRALVETPIKVVEFLGKNTQTFIKSQLTGEAQQVARRLESEGFSALSDAERSILSANRTLGCYRQLQRTTRFIAGPIGVVIGGADLVAETGQTIDSWEAGDPGASVAHGIQAAAAVLSIAVAGAECAALVSGAAAASWAGPVGWIAAALLLIGAIVMSLCSKNDLELFARHCFLGPDYGRGDWDDQTGKAWMAGLPWPGLRYENNTRQESRERWQRQRLALLRMITGYSAYMSYHSYCGGDIYPAYLPGPSSFELEVEVMPRGRQTPMETYRAVVWPNAPAGEQYVWRGQAPGSNSDITVTRHQGKVAMIRVSAPPRGFSSPVDYRFSVRLDLDGNRRRYLPASQAWVRISTTDPGNYHEKKSSEVD